MNASPSLVARGMPRGASVLGSRCVSALLAVALLVIWGGGTAQEVVPAVWKERKFSFAYRSSTNVYTCDALESRVASILRAIGARPDMQVRVSNCRESVLPPGAPVSDTASRNPRIPQTAPAADRLNDSMQSVNVLVRVSMPVEVTPEVAEELKHDKSRRELVSKATGNPGPRFDDPIVFAAQRQVVTVSHETAGIDRAECELLDQMSASGFRELGVRVVRRDFVCDRGRVSLIYPELAVEALMAASHETDDDRKAPAAAGDEADPGAPDASDEGPVEPATSQPPE